MCMGEYAQVRVLECEKWLERAMRGAANIQQPDKYVTTRTRAGKRGRQPDQSNCRPLHPSTRQLKFKRGFVYSLRAQTARPQHTEVRRRQKCYTRTGAHCAQKIKRSGTRAYERRQSTQTNDDRRLSTPLLRLGVVRSCTGGAVLTSSSGMAELDMKEK
jgi:hypothetical protein